MAISDGDTGKEIRQTDGAIGAVAAEQQLDLRETPETSGLSTASVVDKNSVSMGRDTPALRPLARERILDQLSKGTQELDLRFVFNGEPKQIQEWAKLAKGENHSEQKSAIDALYRLASAPADKTPAIPGGKPGDASVLATQALRGLIENNLDPDSKLAKMFVDLVNKSDNVNVRLAALEGIHACTAYSG